MAAVDEAVPVPPGEEAAATVDTNLPLTSNLEAAPTTSMTEDVAGPPAVADEAAVPLFVAEEGALPVPAESEVAPLPAGEVAAEAGEKSGQAEEAAAKTPGNAEVEAAVDAEVAAVQVSAGVGNAGRLEDLIDEALLAELREAFLMGKHPQDSNDCLDSSQLLGVLRSLGIGLSPRELSELLAAADPLGQGQIPWKIFLSFSMHLAAGRKSPAAEGAQLIEAFRQADREGTGMISFRELCRVANHVEQDEAERQAFLQAVRSEEDHLSLGESFLRADTAEVQELAKVNEVNADIVHYEDFVRRYVTDRKWPPSYLGSGGILATA